VKCHKCKRPLTPEMFACKCGEIYVRITGLQPKQRQMLQLIRAKGKDVATKPGFGGARGAAKSRILRDAMLLRRFENPGTAGFIIRRNWSDLEENHLEKFKLERPGLMQFYSNSRQSFEFPNNSRIAFRYADTTAEIQAIARGPEAMDIALDQAEQFSGHEIALLTTPNRWPGAGPGDCKSWLFFNVGDRGAEYLRRIYWLRQFEGTERPEDYVFIQAYGFDNYEWFRNEMPELTFEEFYKIPGDIPPCPEGKHDQAWLESCPKNNRFTMFVTQTTEGRKMWGQPESIRMGDLLGDFEQFAGQYYAGVWNPKLCVISSTLAEDIVKSYWTHWLGVDWGFSHSATSGLLATGKLKPSEFKKYFGKDIDFAVDVIVIKKELVVDHMGEGEFATEICEMLTDAERRMVREIDMSPDAWHKRGSGDTAADQMSGPFKKYKLPMPDKADDDRVGGARLIWNCLKQTCSMLSEVPEVYPGGFPMLLVSAECPQVISMFPMLIVDPDKREDVLKTDTTYDDVYDGIVRYPLKSKLSPNSKVPREVQVREVLTSAGEDPNARAMAMRQFEARNKQSTSIISRPRWRI